MEANKGSPTAVKIRRRFAFPRSEVFRAWTTAAALEKWFAPSDDHRTKVLELDLRVGGRYRIEMTTPEGNVHSLVGVYREIQPPERLVYTWSWQERQEAFGETLVTLEFHDVDNETEVVLTHELLRTEQDRTEHEQGWIGCINRLAEAL